MTGLMHEKEFSRKTFVKGGGALVICSANISNHRISAAAAAAGSTPTAPPTDVDEVTTDTAPTGPTPLLFVAIGLLAFAFVGRRLSRTDTR